MTDRDTTPASPNAPRPSASGVVPGAWAAHGLIFLARIYAGVTIARAGISKLPTPDWMRDQVAQIGFPAPGLFSFSASIVEFAGGVLLLLGLFTRPVAVLLAFTMAVASFGYHRLTPFLEMHIAQGFVWLFVMFIATGAGRISLDALFARARAARPRAAWVLALVVALGPTAFGTYRELALNPAPPANPAANLTIESLNLAGSFNQWSLVQTPMNRLPDSDTWAVDIDLSAAGTVEFKFVANNSWAVNLGAPADAQPLAPGAEATGVPNGGNIVLAIPAPGRYRLQLETRSFIDRAAPATP